MHRLAIARHLPSFDMREPSSGFFTGAKEHLVDRDAEAEGETEIQVMVGFADRSPNPKAPAA